MLSCRNSMLPANVSQCYRSSLTIRMDKHRWLSCNGEVFSNAIDPCVARARASVYVDLLLASLTATHAERKSLRHTALRHRPRRPAVVSPGRELAPTCTS